MPRHLTQNPIHHVSCLFLIPLVLIWNRNSRCHHDSTAGFGSIVRFTEASYLSPPSRTRSRFQRKTTAFTMGLDSRFGLATGREDGVLQSQRQVNDGESGLRVDTIKNDRVSSPTDEGKNIPLKEAFDKVVNARFACPKFQRYQEPPLPSSNETSSPPRPANSIPTVSVSNPLAIQAAYQCLSLAQRSPTGFNSQPYRIVLVHSCEQKAALSQYCLAQNAARVRDSDCTAVFLSDGECGRDWNRFRDFLLGNMDTDAASSLDGTPDATKVSPATTTGNRVRSSSRARRPLSPEELKKMRIFILLLSSGYPLPRIFSRPFSFLVRLGMAALASFFRTLHTLRQKLSRSSSATLKWIYKLFPRKSLLLPTLSSPETWSQKNTMLVAMTYMLACTSRGFSTCPMEGIDAQGIRSVLGIPKRFSIPLIVSTGTPYRDEDGGGLDSVAASDGDGGMSPRYPMEEVVFGNSFGSPLVCPS